MFLLLTPVTAQVLLRGTLATSVNPAELTMELRLAGAASAETMTSTPGLHGQFDFANVKPGHYVLAAPQARSAFAEERPAARP